MCLLAIGILMTTATTVTAGDGAQQVWPSARLVIANVKMIATMLTEVFMS